jgi:hypothetical protein
MFHKLYNGFSPRAGHSSGVSCNEYGLHFAGALALVQRDDRTSGRPFRALPIDQVNGALSGVLGRRLRRPLAQGALQRIADHLNEGEMAKAQICTVQLRLPDIESDDELYRLVKVSELVRFNPNHDDRGRFASVPGAGADGRFRNVTPKGARFSTAIHLSSAQAAMAAKIIDYGNVHGFRPDQITTAVNQAFYESSLGTLEHQSSGKVVGLFQYDAATWRDLGHGALNRNSDADQIIAMYDDIARYESRYDEAEGTGALRKSVFFERYLEVKHHLGNNSTSFFHDVVEEYNVRVQNLDFQL